MPTFYVKVTQVFRVEKDVTLPVEAETAEQAVELIDSREIDVPSADDDLGSNWSNGIWVLQNETVEINHG